MSKDGPLYMHHDTYRAEPGFNINGATLSNIGVGQSVIIGLKSP